jgi:hypothetical protein
VLVKRAEPSCAKSPENLDATHGLEVGDNRSAEGYVNNVKAVAVDRVSSGSVQGEIASTKGKCVGKTFDISTSTGKGEKSESAVMHTDLVMQHINLRTPENISSMGDGVKQQQRVLDLVHKKIGLKLTLQNGRDKAPTISSSASQKVDAVITCTGSAVRNFSSRTYTSVSPMRFKSNTSTSTRRSDWSNRTSEKIKALTVSNQQRAFSAEHGIFVPRTAVRQCRPRNLGGNMIKSVAQGTKSEPHWCPTGLTHTQKRRVQRLRALEIKEEISKKNKDEWFNEDKLMVPLKMTWKEKCIVKEETRNTDDTVAARNSENSRDAPTDMRVDLGG